ncbi:hypothetical protein ACLOJK_013427 [Asimina triloba]
MEEEAIAAAIAGPGRRWSFIRWNLLDLMGTLPIAAVGRRVAESGREEANLEGHAAAAMAVVHGHQR